MAGLVLCASLDLAPILCTAGDGVDLGEEGALLAGVLSLTADTAIAGINFVVVLGLVVVALEVGPGFASVVKVDLAAVLVDLDTVL